jgi:hypothetical protein
LDTVRNKLKSFNTFHYLLCPLLVSVISHINVRRKHVPVVALKNIRSNKRGMKLVLAFKFISKLDSVFGKILSPQNRLRGSNINAYFTFTVPNQFVECTTWYPKKILLKAILPRHKIEYEKRRCSTIQIVKKIFTEFCHLIPIKLCSTGTDLSMAIF